MFSKDTGILNKNWFHKKSPHIFAIIFLLIKRCSCQVICCRCHISFTLLHALDILKCPEYAYRYMQQRNTKTLTHICTPQKILMINFVGCELCVLYWKYAHWGEDSKWKNFCIMVRYHLISESKNIIKINLKSKSSLITSTWVIRSYWNVFHTNVRTEL